MGSFGAHRHRARPLHEDSDGGGRWRGARRAQPREHGDARDGAVHALVFERQPEPLGLVARVVEAVDGRRFLVRDVVVDHVEEALVRRVRLEVVVHVGAPAPPCGSAAPASTCTSIVEPSSVTRSFASRSAAPSARAPLASAPASAPASADGATVEGGMVSPHATSVTTTAAIRRMDGSYLSGRRARTS
jgi:hypothetical protein